MYRVAATSVRPLVRASMREQAEMVMISTNTYAVKASLVYTCAINAAVSSRIIT